MRKHNSRNANGLYVIAKSVYVRGCKKENQDNFIKRQLEHISKCAEIAGFPIVRQFIKFIPKPE